jgi:hypothetical protein
MRDDLSRDAVLDVQDSEPTPSNGTNGIVEGENELPTVGRDFQGAVDHE